MAVRDQKRKLRVAITGPSGLVGSRIIDLLSSTYEFIPLDRDLFNIVDFRAVQKIIQPLSFDIFLHLAAYTDVDKAETEQKKAWDINVNATQYLFNEVQKKNKPFIFVSTSFVFDGKNPPYTEQSLPHPISYYGITKWEAEKIVQGNACIVRFEYPYRSPVNSPRADFVQAIRKKLEKHESISMVNDAVITPTYIDDIAGGLSYLIEQYKPQIYHLVGSDHLTPFQAGISISNIFGLDKKLIHPVSYASYYQKKAPRPFSSIITSIQNTFYPMSSFSEGLQKIIRSS